MIIFQKTKGAIAILWLICALAFFTNHTVISSANYTPTNILSADNSVKEIEGYRNWTKVNALPQLMPEHVSAACWIWLSPTGVEVDGKSNPHRNKYFTVYVNDIGRKAMLNKKRPRFPEGTIIVKEKLPAKDSQTPELLTVMIKQGKGFNPTSGDWEYMAVDGTGTRIEGRGKLQSCQACHVAKPETDYIFRTYLSADVSSKLK
jgi:hypothetical protein